MGPLRADKNSQKRLEVYSNYISEKGEKGDEKKLTFRGGRATSRSPLQQKENASDHQPGSPSNPSGHSFFEVKGRKG